LKHRLAVAYDAESSSPIEIITAVGELCDLIWVVDSSQSLGPMSALLPRLGTMVDLAGLAPEDAVAAVARATPGGIVAFTDSRLPTASMIAAGLGLRFNRPEVTRLFLDKHEQRSALREAGVVVPEFVAIPPRASPEAISALAGAVAFPAVLKPVRGSGSRDTYHVDSADRLVQILATALAEPAGAGEEYLLEEYLPDLETGAQPAFGDYVSVESVVAGAAPRHLAVTGKFPLEAPYRETGNFMPSLLAPDAEAAVTALAGQALAALGVECGCFHTEIKLTPAGPRIIEVNARVGGGGIEDIFVMSYGESLRRVAALAALGLPVPSDIVSRHDGIAYQLFVQPPVTAYRLTRIDGLGEVGGLAGVVDVTVNCRVGDAVDWRRGSQGYVVTIRGSVADRDALQRVRTRIQELLVLEYA